MVSVRDTLSKIIVITDLHPTIYGKKPLEKIVKLIKESKEDIVSVILAGDYESVSIPKKLEEELGVRVIAFPGSHEGFDKTYNYPVKICEITFPIFEVLVPPRTLGEILEDKTFNEIVLLPGSTWCPAYVENPVEPLFGIAEKIIKKYNAKIIISHEHPPGAMSAVAVSGNRLIPIWYFAKEVNIPIRESDIEKIERKYQEVSSKIESEVEDPIRAINEVIEKFYGEKINSVVIKACLVYFLENGWKIKIGTTESPEIVKEFYSSINFEKRMALYGHIHEDPFFRKRHGYKEENLLKINVGPGFLNIFAELCPHEKRVEIIDARQKEVLEEYKL